VTGDRILLTVFDRCTQPLIRYEINDRVRAAAGECDCGRPFGIIETVEGRVEDVLLFSRRDGAAEPFQAHPNLFHEALENLPVSGWQVIHDNSGLSVLLTGLRDASIIEPLRESLARMLRDRGASPPEIRVRVVDALERGATGKAPLIISKMGGKTWCASGG
jgi:phenylacetate-CoA ligase